MHVIRPLFFASIALLAGCQLFDSQPEKAPVNLVRMQGELSTQDGQWQFRPCQEQRRFVVADNSHSDLFEEASTLLHDGPGPLFADLRGQLGASALSGSDGQFSIERFYRIQREGPACADPNFKRLTLHASGHEPDWNVQVSSRGLVLTRPGQAPLALPYLEEQLPDGRFNLTSEANGQRLELWVAPQRCVDNMSGTLQHLSAELRISGVTLNGDQPPRADQVQRGCAYYGGARDK
ncbi:MAG: COG3650 family protein [Pseudomonas sp.]